MMSMSQKVRFMIITGTSLAVIMGFIWYNIGISSQLQEVKAQSSTLDLQLQAGATLPESINSAMSTYKAR